LVHDNWRRNRSSAVPLAHLVGEVYLPRIGGRDRFVSIGCRAEYGGPEEKCPDNVATRHGLFGFCFCAKTLCICKLILQLSTTQPLVSGLYGLNDGWSCASTQENGAERCNCCSGTECHRIPFDITARKALLRRRTYEINRHAEGTSVLNRHLGEPPLRRWCRVLQPSPTAVLDIMAVAAQKCKR